MAALTTVFSGTLPANPTRSSWVAVPASSLYIIRAEGNGIAFEFSLDGTDEFDLTPADLKQVNSSMGMDTYRVANVPFQHMRVWYNSGGTAGAAVVKVLSL